ncbi:hypothetical protein CIG75_06430 [Tumebacillus algifaecis]|uniref:Uncharacterized protein n=1 Tax=Tumebacillus algifaecis TaxID=1214604 RepID=A0A223CZ79_9BACL|nr:hypothetical protein [Tumebacillus algifaecis]ASS74642.1 hypothetical protein CIG75_06430 [Tumebacillus algifaecis]
MIDLKKQASQFPTEDVMMGQDVNVPDNMEVPGEQDTTIWDNMVQALKPDLAPHHVKTNPNQQKD